MRWHPPPLASSNIADDFLCLKKISWVLKADVSLQTSNSVQYAQVGGISGAVSCRVRAGTFYIQGYSIKCTVLYYIIF